MIVSKVINVAVWASVLALPAFMLAAPSRMLAEADLFQIPPLRPQIIEAEDVVLPSVQKVPDASASGGVYVTSSKEWTTLVRVPVPSAESNESIAVWVRTRGLSIALKAEIDPVKKKPGKELAWTWKPGDTLKDGAPNPAAHEWGWRRLGTWRRETLGDHIHLMRGRDNSSEGAGLDAIFFGPVGASPEKTGQANSSASSKTVQALGDLNAPLATPDGKQNEMGSNKSDGGAATSRGAARLSIDWAETLGEATRRQFGLNLMTGFEARTGEKQRLYSENLTYFNPGFVRYHAGGKPFALWFDYQNRIWDREKIKAALDSWTPPATGNASVGRMLNISGAPRKSDNPQKPGWFEYNQYGWLDPGHYDEFGDLCADLARTINIEQKRGFEYFEITNEHDFAYWRNRAKAGEPTNAKGLGELFVAVAKKIRAVDPSIKLGGPASCRGEPWLTESFHREFAQVALPWLDFFSFHCYPTGSADTSDSKVYDGIAEMGEMIRAHRKMLDKLSPNRRIEIHLTEYNVNWAWNVGDPRMANHKGAVFDSLFFIEAVRSGLDVGAAWNDHDGTYGKADYGYAIRPAGRAFHYFNNWLVGRAVKVSGEIPRMVVAFAVEQQGERRSLVLVNRTGETQTAILPDDVFGIGVNKNVTDLPVSTVRIAGDGLWRGSVTVAKLRNAELGLPSDSVTFLTLPFSNH
ncbi:glycosyl hydrolase family 39 [Opitutaceae bacterium TAV1]|nr:glycosyl hydrolase family 39 [Opitutaceae bacterium TAV1]